MNKYKEILSIKRCDFNKYFVENGSLNNPNLFLVEFDFVDNTYYSKEFKNKEEIIVFMEKEYFQIKCRYLENNIIKLNTKIKNQAGSLYKLQRAYNISKKEDNYVTE